MTDESSADTRSRLLARRAADGVALDAGFVARQTVTIECVEATGGFAEAVQVGQRWDLELGAKAADDAAFTRRLLYELTAPGRDMDAVLRDVAEAMEGEGQ